MKISHSEFYKIYCDYDFTWFEKKLYLNSLPNNLYIFFNHGF